MSVEEWTSAPFHDEVRTWVGDRLAEHGLRLTGEWEQPHARTWSSAIRFGTTAGRVWFKVNGVGTAHEASLVRLIDELVPGLVPEVLAVDASRGWSVSRDAGPMLRASKPPEELWDAWEGVVARYAEAQIVLSGHREAVLATGVVEVSPATTPALARALVAELSAASVDEGGLSDEQSQQLAGVLPALDAWCAELAETGVPDSVQHDDLHSANVCWPGTLPAARIIDWGDSSWGHPFGTMLATLNSIAFHAGVHVDGQPVTDRSVLRVRDAYLEPFTTYAGRAELHRAVDLARRTGCVAKALSYRAAMAGATVEAQAEHDFPVREWLLGLLDD
ncbi:MAG: phosphotransferase [Nocardioidaceae bacterium]